jgi:NitT/TauT family transport system permease protein
VTAAGRALGAPTLRGRQRTPFAARVRYYGPAVVVFVGVLAAWELFAGGGAVFLLPPPSSIAAALAENWDAGRWPLASAARNTLFEVLLGLGIGISAGIAVAFVTSRWVGLRDTLLPLAVALNAVPIIALAPLLNNWFGLTNPLSKALVAALLVFFPVMINVTRGLVMVSPSSLELMRSYAATEWTVLRKVRIPNALPFFFTSLKVATTLALIGAIVAEYFGGSSEVLGRVIVQSASALRFDVTWAAIVLASVSGIALYLAVTAIERLVIPWHASERAG